MTYSEYHRVYYKNLDHADQWYWTLNEDLHCEYSAALLFGRATPGYCLHGAAYTVAEWCTATGRNLAWHVLNQEGSIE